MTPNEVIKLINEISKASQEEIINPTITPETRTLSGARGEIIKWQGDMYFDPSSVDYGTMPSDLVGDEVGEAGLIRQFLEQFGSELAGKDVSKLLKVLGDIGSGNADADDLRNVDLEDLKDIDGVEEFVSGVVNTVQELNALGDSTADDTTQDDFQTTSTQEIVDGYDDLTDDQKEAIDNAIVLGANVYTGKFGLPVITFPNAEEAGGASAGGGASSSGGDSSSASSDTSASNADDSVNASDVVSTAGGADSKEGDLPKIGEWVFKDGVWKQVGGYSGELGTQVVVYSGEIIVGPGSEGDVKSQSDWEIIFEDGGFDDGTYTKGTDYNSDSVLDGSGDDTTVSTKKLVNWVWDAVTSTWNPVYQGDVVADNAILSNTTDEPTDAPSITTKSTDPLITDTVTSVLGDAINQVDTPTSTTNNTSDSNNKNNDGKNNNTLLSDITGLLNDAINQIGKTNGNGKEDNGNGDDGGGDDGGGNTEVPGAGTYAGGYCKTRGENGGTFVARYNDGKGGFYEEERFEAACKSTKNTGGVGNGGGTGVGDGVGPGIGGPSEEPPPEEPPPEEQVAQPTAPSSPFTAEGEITYINPSLVNIIEPSAIGSIAQGLFSNNAMDASAGLLGRLSMSSQQSQDLQQQFGKGQVFGDFQGLDSLQGFNNLSMFDRVLNRNYMG